jgi:thiamine pyrophosphokinase
MKIIIFAGGEYSHPEFYKRICQQCDFKIAADSGAEFMRKINISPDLLIGDMDSISEKTLKFFEEQKVKVLKFPTHKDEIDTELALNEASKKAPDLILIAGAFGSRLDQTIAVFRLMQRSKNVVLFNEKLYALRIKGKITLSSVKEEVWSILPLRKDVNGVSLKGFEYSISNRKMEYLKPYGVSNQAISTKVSIDAGDGELLIFRYHNGEVGWVEELSEIFKSR